LHIINPKQHQIYSAGDSTQLRPQIVK